MSIRAVPRPVQLAGWIVGMQGVIGLVFAAALLVRAVSTPRVPGENVYALAGYFGLLGAAVITVGIALVRGRRWARSPAVVVQILLLGTSWYAITSAARWVIGGPVAVLCAAALVLLFLQSSRIWAVGDGRSSANRDTRGSSTPGRGGRSV